MKKDGYKCYKVNLFEPSIYKLINLVYNETSEFFIIFYCCLIDF